MKITVLKLGGNVLDDENALGIFLDAFAALQGMKILIHGGGKVATELSKQLGIEATLIEGRRVTDADTLRVVTMVYAGLLNKTLVAGLQQRSVNAFGLCGADGNSIRSHKRVHPSIDYGYVGDVDAVDTAPLLALLHQNCTPVIAPITHNGEGQLLNTNADTIAAEVASALTSVADVSLWYCFEKAGVLLDIDDASSLIKELNSEQYNNLREQGAIAKGMIPKLDNAFRAAARGVQDVRIMRFSELLPQSGTLVCRS